MELGPAPTDFSPYAAALEKWPEQFAAIKPEAWCTHGRADFTKPCPVCTLPGSHADPPFSDFAAAAEIEAATPITAGRIPAQADVGDVWTKDEIDAAKERGDKLYHEVNELSRCAEIEADIQRIKERRGGALQPFEDAVLNILRRELKAKG